MGYPHEIVPNLAGSMKGLAVPRDLANEALALAQWPPSNSNSQRGRWCSGPGESGHCRETLIYEETVKVHIKHIMEKLGASDRTQAVAVALCRGIIQSA